MATVSMTRASRGRTACPRARCRAAVLEHRGQLEQADEEVLHGVDLRGEDGRPVAEAVGEDGADDRRRQAARAHDGLVEREAHDRRRAEVPRGLEQQLGAHLAVLARRVLEAEHGALRHDVLEARVGQRVGEVLAYAWLVASRGEPHGGAASSGCVASKISHARLERDVRRAAREWNVERHLGRRLADALRGDAPHASPCTLCASRTRSCGCSQRARCSRERIRAADAHIVCTKRAPRSASRRRWPAPAAPPCLGVAHARSPSSGRAARPRRSAARTAQSLHGWARHAPSKSLAARMCP